MNRYWRPNHTIDAQIRGRDEGSHPGVHLTRGRGPMPKTTGLAATFAIIVLVGGAGAGFSASATDASDSHVVAIDGTGDFVSIQAAVDAAASGDTVIVKPGMYDGPVEIDKDLSLIGDGPREAIMITPSAEAAHAILLTSASVIVTDLTVATPEKAVGVVATSGAPLIERVSFVGPEEVGTRSSAHVHRPFISMRFVGDTTPTVRESEWDGPVAVRAGASATFVGNTVVGDTISIDGPGESSVRDSVLLRGSISMNRDATGLIEGNEFHGDLGQVGVDSGSVVEVRGNTFTGSADGAAIWIADRATSAIVTGNRVIGSDNAVRISGAGSVTVQGNELEASTMGISISGTDAHIEGNTIESDGAGIVIVSGAKPTIVDNAIDAGGRAVVVTPDSAGTITGNVICGGESGIHADGSAELYVDDNGICDTAGK